MLSVARYGTNDLAKATLFYDAITGLLGASRVIDREEVMTESSTVAEGAWHSGFSFGRLGPVDFRIRRPLSRKCSPSPSVSRKSTAASMPTMRTG